MKQKLIVCVLSVVIAVSGAAAAPAGVRAADRANIVIAWNGIMMPTYAPASVPARISTRLGAMVQAAVFDAVNGVHPSYTPIHVVPAAPDNASWQAAAAGAAYTALVSLFPLQKAALDADLAASVAAMKGDDDDSNSAVTDGLAWGAAVAAQILSWRSADGLTSLLPPYVQGSAIGDWAPTPGGSGPPKFRTLAVTTPFALTSPSQFRPDGPPALTSAKYATDFNEVQAYGSA